MENLLCTAPLILNGIAGFFKGKEACMAVMLYGIVSTTRAKQIAQTGIVSEGLTTISPVTLKFGSNEVNYFFFNRKDAEEVEYNGTVI